MTHHHPTATTTANTTEEVTDMPTDPLRARPRRRHRRLRRNTPDPAELDADRRGVRPVRHVSAARLRLTDRRADLPHRDPGPRDEESRVLPRLPRPRLHAGRPGPVHRDRRARGAVLAGPDEGAHGRLRGGARRTVPDAGVHRDGAPRPADRCGPRSSRSRSTAAAARVGTTRRCASSTWPAGSGSARSPTAAPTSTTTPHPWATWASRSGPPSRCAT